MSSHELGPVPFDNSDTPEYRRVILQMQSEYGLYKPTAGDIRTSLVEMDLTMTIDLAKLQLADEAADRSTEPIALFSANEMTPVKAAHEVTSSTVVTAEYTPAEEASIEEVNEPTTAPAIQAEASDLVIQILSLNQTLLQ